jgi:hypothetical protein
VAALALQRLTAMAAASGTSGELGVSLVGKTVYALTSVRVETPDNSWFKATNTSNTAYGHHDKNNHDVDPSQIVCGLTHFLLLLAVFLSLFW